MNTITNEAPSPPVHKPTIQSLNSLSSSLLEALRPFPSPD